MTHFAVVTSSAVLGLLVGSFLNVVIAACRRAGRWCKRLAPFLVVAALAQALYGEPLPDWLRGMS